MARYVLIYVLVIALVSCKKSEPDGVMINVENFTSSTLDSVKLFYDTSNYNYGTVLPGKTTAYIFFKNISETPVAIVILGNKKILAGRLMPPNTYNYPTLTNGKYTLQIFPDSTLFYFYNAKFIKN
jgi:hypothetical protein